ncbi:MAG: hypothetical protein U7127_21215 [Phormidium sp.]
MSNVTILSSNSQEHWIKLSINGTEEKYSLEKPPEINSCLVQESRQYILQNLSINSLVLDLTNAADLMFLAYNALAGTQVQSKVSGLQKSLLDISGDCTNILEIFGIQSQEVTKSLIKIYKWLLAGEDKLERLALVEIKRCGKIAGDMANQAQELAGRFQHLGNESKLVNQDAHDMMNFNYIEKSNLNDKLRKLKQQEEKAQGSRDMLEKATIDLTREYEKEVAKLQDDDWFKRVVEDFVGLFGIRDKAKEDALSQAHKDYNQALQQLNQQKLENLNSLQKYALEISKASHGIDNAAKSVETFHYAVVAISVIAATLSDTTIFWRSIERYCKQPEKSKLLLNQFNALQGKFSAAKKVEKYTSNRFMVLFVTSLSQWVAFDSVCREYLTAAKNTYNKISTNIAASPSIQIAKARTPSLAQQIFDSIEQHKKIFK